LEIAEQFVHGNELETLTGLNFLDLDLDRGGWSRVVWVLGVPDS
jgi:hypothetical protein